MGGLFFSEPLLLWLVPVIIFLGLVYTRIKGKSLLVLSRIVILCLLIIALANPYMVVTQTVESKRPVISVIADHTSSMKVFDMDIAQRVQDSLPDSQLRFFSGDKTPLGDKILQNSRPGETLVLVSDGYSNQGRDLEESLGLARLANTTIFAIDISPTTMDASVEIEGTNTAVLGGEYPFSLIVRWSGGTFDGILSVYADERLIYENYILEDGRLSSIKMSHTFHSIGTHILRATITPREDLQQVNNQYFKAVYVVPKPDVLLVSEGSSPLRNILSELYDLTMISDVPRDFEGFKAVVLDNQRYKPDLDPTEYVREGGGLVVVGGSGSYDLGGYYNSSLEDILPVRSIPSIFLGGKVVVMVLDISSSMQQKKMIDGTAHLDYEKSLAIELLRSPEFRDDLIGIVVFGSEAYNVSEPIPLQKRQIYIEDTIAKLWPTGAQETHLDDGLQLAWHMLNRSAFEGELIIISDGALTDDVFLNSGDLIKKINVTTYLIQVQAFEGAPGRLRSLAEATGAAYYPATYPSSVTVRAEEPREAEEIEDTLEPIDGYPLAVFIPSHYITTDLTLNASVTGFNDVTPRPGSQRLVILSDGKPILTTWRYGLGRVASLTTDDGTKWAPAIYSAENSQLISAMVNWAVGDPRPEIGRIDAEDGWLGTPIEISIISDSPPKIDSTENIRLERAAENRYSAKLTPDRVGIYYIGDYGIAVNYPLEFRDVGFNPQLAKLIMANGGRMFTEEEVRISLMEEARRRSEMTVQERESRRGLLLLSALVIFLAEVIRRRMKEIR
jgi:uncharacterized membrane protein